jgi:polar amino acid transport system substrate-binding protein
MLTGRISLTILFCMALTIRTANAHEVDAFTLCYEDQHYPPYIFGDATSPQPDNPGIMLEIAFHALNKSTSNIKVIRRPFKRCMSEVRDNRADAMFAAFQPERINIGAFPMKANQPNRDQRALTLDFSLFTRPEKGFIWDGTHFVQEDLKIGTPLGYSTVKSLRNNHQLDPVTSFLPDTGLENVAQNKIDGYIVDRNVGKFIILEKHLEEDVHIHPVSYQKFDIYLTFSHHFYENHSKIAENIWSELAIVRKNMLDRLIIKYKSVEK